MLGSFLLSEPMMSFGGKSIALGRASWGVGLGGRPETGQEARNGSCHYLCGQPFILSPLFCLNSETYRLRASGVPMLNCWVIQALVALVFCFSRVASITFHSADLVSVAINLASFFRAKRPLPKEPLLLTTKVMT